MWVSQVAENSPPQPPAPDGDEDPAAGFDTHKARTRESKDIADKLAEREAEIRRDNPAQNDFVHEVPTRPRGLPTLPRSDD